MLMVSTFSNIFSSETTGPIEAKMHVEPLYDMGMKVRSNGPGYVYIIKTLKNFFSGTYIHMTLKLSM